MTICMYSLLFIGLESIQLFYVKFIATYCTFDISGIFLSYVFSIVGVFCYYVRLTHVLKITYLLVYLLTWAVDLEVDEGEDEPVGLPNVNAAILKKVIQWCTYHKDDPPTAEDDENKEKRTDDICTWDVEFLKVDQGTLFELILVSTNDTKSNNNRKLIKRHNAVLGLVTNFVGLTVQPLSLPSLYGSVQ